MNRPNDPIFDSRIADWLEDDPDHAPGLVLETVVAAVPSIPQRHALRLPWRFPSMPISMRLVAAAVIGVVALGVLYLNLPGRVGVGSPTSSPTESVVDLGTITMTDNRCSWAGNPGSITTPFESTTADVTVVNETDTFATFGVYRLDDAYTWEHAAAWIVAENAALHGGPTNPPQDFASQFDANDVPKRRAHEWSVTLTSGRFGVVCASNPPPRGVIPAIYLVGPFEITVSK